eukprot:s3391_g8.t1
MLLKCASDCFSLKPVDTSTGVGGLQASLGDATSCVLTKLEQRWGWKPELVGSGSNTGGPYDAYGAGATIIGVDTPSGKWQFTLKKGAHDGGNGTPSEEGGSESVIVSCFHRGDASSEHETDLIHFTETCFGKHHIDISNVGSLDQSLDIAISCVLQTCEKKWGWKPQLSVWGSDAGGPYDAYGSGATVIGAKTSTGKWEFVLHKTGGNTGGNIHGTPTHDKGSKSVSVSCLHGGAATSEQETDLIHFTEKCLEKHHIDISNVGNFDQSMATATTCVLEKCEQKWGWKPQLSVWGSKGGGPYDTYGMGATVIGAQTKTGKWDFVLHLK